MTPKELEDCLAILRWGPATLAQALDAEVDVVEGWLSGRAAIPARIVSWLEAIRFNHESAELLRPDLTSALEEQQSRPDANVEHVPVYSYHLLRRLGRERVPVKSLFGTDDEAAVAFLISRGLAERKNTLIGITKAGRDIGTVRRSHANGNS